MVGKTIKYKTRSDEEFDGYLTKPGIDDPLPGIVVIPAIFGTDEDMIQLTLLNINKYHGNQNISRDKVY